MVFLCAADGVEQEGSLLDERMDAIAPLGEGRTGEAGQLGGLHECGGLSLRRIQLSQEGRQKYCPDAGDEDTREPKTAGEDDRQRDPSGRYEVDANLADPTLDQQYEQKY